MGGVVVVVVGMVVVATDFCGPPVSKPATPAPPELDIVALKFAQCLYDIDCVTSPVRGQ